MDPKFWIDPSAGCQELVEFHTMHRTVFCNVAASLTGYISLYDTRHVSGVHTVTFGDE
jgi:hypothetical protein